LTTDANLALAHVWRERNVLDQAGQFLAKARDSVTTTRRSVSLAIYAAERALLDLAEGRPARGLRQITAFRANGSARPPVAIDARLSAIEVRLLLETGHRVHAESLLDGLLDCAEKHSRPEVRAIAVQLSVAHRDITAAGRLLRDWPNSGDERSDLDRRLWSAIVKDLNGEHREGLDQMAAVVSSAEPEGHVRLFLDAGDDALRLLGQLLRSNPSPYLRQLVRSGRLAASSLSPDTKAAMEALSPRELVVLQYVPSRLSNSEIASRLYISTNTVKTHLQSIYRKLDVTRRNEAADKAEHLGLV
jgi:LuxR family maltose regulon positive regulatory protein